MANIQIIRLVTGEELIGKVIKDDAKGIEVENVVRIVVVPTKADPNNPSVGFAPFMQWSDEKVLTINRNHVITVVKPITEFLNQYNTMFGGLVVPQTKIIT